MGHRLCGGWVASCFLRCRHLSSVSTRSPFATEWTVSKRSALSSKCVSNCGSSAQKESALNAMLFRHLLKLCKS